MKNIVRLLRLIGATTMFVFALMILSLVLGDSATVHAQALVCGSPAPTNYWPLDESGSAVFTDLTDNYDASCTGGQRAQLLAQASAATPNVLHSNRSYCTGIHIWNRTI